MKIEPGESLDDYAIVPRTALEKQRDMFKARGRRIVVLCAKIATLEAQLARIGQL